MKTQEGATADSLVAGWHGTSIGNAGNSVATESAPYTATSPGCCRRTTGWRTSPATPAPPGTDGGICAQRRDWRVRAPFALMRVRPDHPGVPPVVSSGGTDEPRSETHIVSDRWDCLPTNLSLSIDRLLLENAAVISDTNAEVGDRYDVPSTGHGNRSGAAGSGGRGSGVEQSRAGQMLGLYSPTAMYFTGSFR